LWYSSNHLEYIGYGNVAPAPVNEICALALNPAKAVSYFVLQSSLARTERRLAVDE
jgi:hypothetical protein